VPKLSHERVLKTLVNLGLSHTDAEVYIHLAIKGPQKVGNLADALKLLEKPLSQSLENLKSKGIVNSELEYSQLFFALPFDKALELLMKAHLTETRNIEQNKSEILSKWQAMTGDSRRS